jgi:hypothetical protein
MSLRVVSSKINEHKKGLMLTNISPSNIRNFFIEP